jgi:hypothetical protein
MTKTTQKSSGFTFDDAAFRKKIPFPLIATNLPGAYTSPAPPETFDATTASPSELLRHGLLLPRPLAGEDPMLLKAWNELFSRKWREKDRIAPILEPQLGKTPILKRPSEGGTEGLSSFFNTRWAGAVFSGGGPWVSIVGYWASRS